MNLNNFVRMVITLTGLETTWKGEPLSLDEAVSLDGPLTAIIENKLPLINDLLGRPELCSSSMQLDFNEKALLGLTLKQNAEINPIQLLIALDAVIDAASKSPDGELDVSLWAEISSPQWEFLSHQKIKTLQANLNANSPEVSR